MCPIHIKPGRSGYASRTFACSTWDGLRIFMTPSSTMNSVKGPINRGGPYSVAPSAGLLTVLSVTEIVVVGKDQHTEIANRHEAVIVDAIGSHGVTELRRRGREVAGPR